MEIMDSDTAIELTELPPKQQAFAILKEKGLKAKDISKMVGYTEGSGYIVNAKLNKLKLTHPKMVKDAHTVLKNILRAEPIQVDKTYVTKEGQVIDYIDNIYPTHTNQVAVAQMVFDRVEPVIRQSVNLNLNADISPVDLSKYRNR